jgi:type IV pilus assembly protein PilZ
MVTKKDRRSASKTVESDRRASGRDRRQHERILVDIEVDYRCEDTFLFAYITDISAMGIFIQTNNPEPPGSHLNLRFSPPGTRAPLELEGEVIWINPYRPGDRENLNPGMGIKFINLTLEQRDQLTTLVKTFAYLSDDDEDDEEIEGEQTFDGILGPTGRS